MLRKRVIGIGVLLCLVGLSSGYVVEKKRKVNAPPGSHSSLGYTIELFRRSVFIDQGKTITNRETRAVRPNGDMVEILWGKDTDHPLVKTLNLREIGQGGGRIEAFYDTLLKTTIKFKPVARSASYDVTCKEAHLKLKDREYIGDDTHIGLHVVKFVQKLPGLKREYWMSPDCDCMVVFSRTEFARPDGTIYSTAELTATKVSFGEPTPQLFEIPDMIKEVPPLEFISKTYTSHGQALPESVRATYARLERENYR